jgi:hypothetical protein
MRVSRFLVQLVPQFKWSACDVNPFSIEWAKTAFGNRANIFLSNAWPPLPVADQSFDVVFAWSIFSHYSEAAHRAWLEEMHRVLWPDLGRQAARRDASKSPSAFGPSGRRRISRRLWKRRAESHDRHHSSVFASSRIVRMVLGMGLSSVFQ